MHLTDEEIQRLLHGELDAATQAERTHHVGGCAECRRRVEEARQEEARILGLLGRLDHPLPVVGVDAVVARARGTGSPALRRAAVILVALAIAGTAYAMPGSPLRAWVDRVARSFTGRKPEASAPAQAPPAQTPTAGIAVMPGPRFTIQFTSPQPSGVVTVSRVDGANVVVRALHGPATFTTSADDLVINNRGSTADYEIELPRNAGWIEIQVGRRRLLLQQNGRITGVPASEDGRYSLSLASPQQ